MFGLADFPLLQILRSVHLFCQHNTLKSLVEPKPMKLSCYGMGSGWPST